jgi:hypothetical protein
LPLESAAGVGGVSFLDYDFAEMATRVQRGLDRLTANYLAAHGARVHLDVVDFHGREHLDFELRHGDHSLRVRQVGPVRGLDDPGEPRPEEFESVFDGRPSRGAETRLIADWLAALPAGRAAPEPRPTADPDNPFLGEPRPTPRAPGANPLLDERPAAEEAPNPFARPGEDEARRRALRWLSEDQE